MKAEWFAKKHIWPLQKEEYIRRETTPRQYIISSPAIGPSWPLNRSRRRSGVASRLAKPIIQSPYDNTHGDEGKIVSLQRITGMRADRARGQKKTKGEDDKRY
ncbi:hypothetical protein I7I50_02926 [Histoplasma capsulatum G186AR]|uniref:Uncharacterized protein n=1 Tax=Ajellomyces capsulatus TaxID=5037 RepID=A0A8H8D6E0_AJECA|nr:hypothetical protein I7I52_00407 [Histoplasma capsulatum]QSS71909.1 hypothetical protein I7I50_02926 [Histoplasma capsulatum G186AR]